MNTNPTEVGLPYDEARIRAALDQPIVYRPDPLGHLAAREAICSYYLERGLVADPSRIVLTASTSEAYAYALHVLCDPGDAVLIPRPSYPLFDYLLDLAGVRAIPYRMAWDGAWYLDRASVEHGLAQGAKAMFVVSPNNPTGTVLDASDRAFVLGKGAVIVSDEVFLDYAAVPASLVGAEQPVLSLSGLSKIAGLPQLKLGWMVASGPGEWVSEVMARLEIVADTYLSVGTPVQRALPALLALAGPWQESLRERLAENLRVLRETISGTAVRARPSQGGWCAMIDVPRTESDESWCVRLLAEDGVSVQPGYFFDVEEQGCLVLSLIVPPGEFREGVQRLVARVNA